MEDNETVKHNYRLNGSYATMPCRFHCMLNFNQIIVKCTVNFKKNKQIFNFF